MECRVPILAYHSIADDGPTELAPFRVSCAAFRKQMRYLRERGYHSMSLTDWAPAIATQRFVPGRPVVITFDDGYADFATNAWPVLAEMDLRVTIFVVTGRVGGVADWDHTAQTGLTLLAWDELRSLQQQGNAIGSHCAAHQVLTNLSDDEIAADASAARAALRRELATEVTCVSYPWGNSDARVRRICAENGYRSGVGVTPGVSGLSDDLMNLPRIEIFGSDDIEAFAGKLGRTNDRADSLPSQRYAQAPPPSAAEPTPPQPDPMLALSARLQRLVDELTSIKHELAAVRAPSASLHSKLMRLFAQPLSAPAGELMTPFQQASPGIRIGFEPTARVRLTVLPKHDHTVSPDSCLNVLRLAYAGASRWFSLDVTLAWPELENARRYQLGLSMRPSRPIICRAVLRLWQKDKQYIELDLAEFVLDPDQNNYNCSGELTLPDSLLLDHDSDPLFLVLFDTNAVSEIELNYLNLYFA